ncbi:hypothetical protein E2562_004817 [Oryza meyeriana var. granulata]|uniref:DUF7887 domain-containing protein n=1 Tax=Oryza meyeriana var. granulata TaxID=110450 RepID=A0A6G1DF73_9ORYZ|nr:hypothetical protein E2562_004817 [Oryza meyeriana var. granulata]
MPTWAAGAKAVVLLVPSPSTPAPLRSRGAAAARARARGGRPRPCSAQKPGSEERGAGGVVLSRGALLRSGAALFALGFVDAGYSGDWSRIGAISKDTEELLKLGAYAVVPLCLLAFVFLPSSEDSSNTES